MRTLNPKLLSAKGVELLKRVKKHILEEPLRGDMNVCAMKFPRADGGPACGTAGCIAGWILMLSDQSKMRDPEDLGEISDFNEAARLIGFDTETAWTELFTTSGIYSTAGTREHANEIAARIDKFIKEHTKG